MKILVGMSGGVDSSAAALLLKEQGHEVTGATLKMFAADDIIQTDRKCGSLTDIRDARAVADRLGFGHIVMDMSEGFREKVMGHFANAYLSGNTPNPCIQCNRHIKFGMMLDKALEMGFDAIATGHYAECRYDEKSGRFLLIRPADRSKDQTYVLYSLTQHQLAHTVFPLGGMEKAQVRAMAESAGLVNSQKPDSQDICFVPNGKYADFITHFTGITSPSGNFADMSGKILGQHKGIINYTIGQRKGLGISLGKPAYVVSKDMENNLVILGDEEDLFTQSLIAEDVNLISVAEVTEPMRITAKTRYTQHEESATLTAIGGGRYRVDFDKPQRAVTKGQAVVFYDGELVVGGGTIV